MNTSIVIPLAGTGHGSRWNDLELKFCLRSITKHLTGYADIFLIGHKPDWVKNIIHIPAIDGEKTYEKERNIFNKIMIACKDERVSEEFLFMNDDHFLLKDYVASVFPYYWEGSLSDQLCISDYKYTVANTLEAASRDWLYFDVHTPIIYKKEFLNVLDCCYDWSVKFGYCIKSLYCNTFIKSGVSCQDLKIRDPFPADKIREMIAGRSWFSIGHKACTPEMLTVLSELYPSKSPYEK